LETNIRSNPSLLPFLPFTILFLTGTTLGAIIGGLLAGALSDLVGRKPVTLLSSIIFVVGAALMTFAHSYWLLLLGRVVVGVGVGKFCSIACGRGRMAGRGGNLG